MPNASAPSVIDFVNLVALFLAVWHTVRRLDAARHGPERHPAIDSAEVGRWQSAALRAHAIVIWTCFAYIALDLAFKALALPDLARINLGAARAVGASLFAIWLVGVAIGIYRVRNAERWREQLGIDRRPGSDS